MSSSPQLVLRSAEDERRQLDPEVEVAVADLRRKRGAGRLVQERQQRAPGGGGRLLERQRQEELVDRRAVRGGAGEDLRDVRRREALAPAADERHVEVPATEDAAARQPRAGEVR